MISNFNTAILQMEFSLNHQLMRNLGLYQGPILWAYWHQSFPRQVGGVWLRSMKNLKGSQPQRWIESSLGILKNSHLFSPELSGWWIISYSWGFLRLKIMENSNHFVPREKLFIFEIASLTKWSPHLARAACEAVQVAWKHTEKKVEPLVLWPFFKSIKSCWGNKSYWANKFSI